MHKIWLVTQREYLTRVTNKTFILTTLLTPVGVLLFMAVMVWVMSTGSDTKRTIAVYDPSALLAGTLEGRENQQFLFPSGTLDSVLALYLPGTIDGILEVPPMADSTSQSYKYRYHSDDQLAMDEGQAIKEGIEKRITQYKIRKLNLDTMALNRLETKLTMEPVSVREEKNVSSMTTIVSSVLGGVVGYAMFFVILFYGMQVMRSVMEEKVNRIVEVLMSSLKPFELMMGKVLGVGLVGLTQIAMWAILVPLAIMVGSAVFGLEPASTNPAMGQAAEASSSMGKNEIALFLTEVRSMNWLLILPLSLFYFLMGYFAYSALFAAIGSAVGEDINEANSLTLPVMLPLMISMYIGLSAVNAPNSSLAVWASMVPLVSSVVMPVRLPFDPPWWQIAVSVISLVVFAVLLIWLAARIYRVGILMYGKKASFKEIAHWLFYKG
jgi:ABC-2 type transport system permease protein